MIDFGMATCCCEKCDCVNECEFFAQSIKPVVEAVNANYDTGIPFHVYFLNLFRIITVF